MLMWATTWQNQLNARAPSEESDQPGHPPSLIRVFAVRMKKAWVLSYSLSAQRRLWSGRMPRLIWVFAWHTATALVLSCRGSCIAWHPDPLILIWSRNGSGKGPVMIINFGILDKRVSNFRNTMWQYSNNVRTVFRRCMSAGKWS